MDFIHDADIDQLSELQDCLNKNPIGEIKDIWVVLEPYYIAVTQDDKIVGVISISLFGGGSELYKLYVMPNYTRRGLGKALVNEAIRFLSKLKIPEVYLEIVGDSYNFWSSALSNLNIENVFGNKYIIYLR